MTVDLRMVRRCWFDGVVLRIRGFHVVAAGIFALLSAQASFAASLTMTPSNTSPTRGELVSLSEQGSTEQTGVLHTYYELGASTCAATAGDQAARVNSRSIDFRFPDQGSFSYTGQFKPDDYGTFLICGYLSYLADADQAPPRASAAATVTVATPAPPGIQLFVSRPASLGSPASFHTYPRAEVPGTLRLYIERATGSCASSADEELARASSSTLAYRGFGPGAPAFTDSYKPLVPGSYLVCAYVEENEAPRRAVMASATFTVRVAPPPPPAIGVARRARLGATLRPHIIARGGSASGTVRVYVDTRACAATSTLEGARPSARRLAVRRIPARGVADFRATFKPRTARSYVFCAFSSLTGSEEVGATAVRTQVLPRRKRPG